MLPKRLSLRCQMAYSRRGNIRGIDVYNVNTIARRIFLRQFCAASGPALVLSSRARGGFLPAEPLRRAQPRFQGRSESKL